MERFERFCKALSRLQMFIYAHPDHPASLGIFVRESLILGRLLGIMDAQQVEKKELQRAYERVLEAL